jgi:hypothetical protein
VKLRTSIAVTAAAALIGTGAFMLPAVASASAPTHTLKFTSVTKSQIMFSVTSGAVQDTDLNSKGKTVGFDMLYFAYVSGLTAPVNLTFDVAGGVIYGTGQVSITTMAFTDGKVTGGTGAFKSATGTIAEKTLSKTKSAVTITYRT